MSDKQKINWSELTEAEKTQLARDVAKIWVNRWNEEHIKAISDLFTPFYIRWFYWMRDKIQRGNK
jgi:hypothetical protein